MHTATPYPQSSQRSLSSELATVLPGALLLLMMVSPVVWALSVSNWAPGLDLLRPMALLGLIVGVVFARLPRLPAWLAHLLSAALALTWAVQLLGPLMDTRLTTWRDYATELLIRSAIWARVINSGGRGEDILLFVFVLCLLVWVLAYSSAWMVLRRSWTWRPMLLNATVALVNYTYVQPKPTLAFFIFLCAALLLLVYQHVLQRQAAWDAQQVEYPDLLALRFLSAAAVVVGLLIALTAALPGEVSIDRATRTWTTISSPFRAAREGWEDLFSTISAPPGAGSGAFTTGTAPLGGARQLTTDLVMEVRSTEYDYWRGAAFDKYTGSDWQNTVGEQARATLGVATREQARTSRAADETIPLFDTFARRPISQTVTLATDRLDDLIMVGGMASSVSIPTMVEHNYLREGTASIANFDETALIVSNERLRAGQSYTVTALVSFADVAGLRAAGSDYPAWVRERYLQLPETVTERTYELAARLVAEAGARTPYDQAMLFQDYLRTIPYNENIPVPPPDADHVDWFLFTQREGYCDYFASAMVVMLRAQGVPARWVRGYAGGEFDNERGVYQVRENVAHSWPEVYFPGYGWERFEPTPAGYTSPPLRPLTTAFGADASEQGLPLPPSPTNRFDDLDAGLEPDIAPVEIQAVPTRPGLDLGHPLMIAASLLGTLLLLAGAVYARWRYELRGLSQAGTLYAGMALLAGWSGLPQSAQRTPLEYGATLATALPEHGTTIERIATAYAREQYGGPATAPTRLFSSHSARLPAEEELRALHHALLRRIVIRPRPATLTPEAQRTPRL
jgi:transglutaminase-like putative cysteine protease